MFLLCRIVAIGHTTKKWAQRARKKKILVVWGQTGKNRSKDARHKFEIKRRRETRTFLETLLLKDADARR